MSAKDAAPRKLPSADHAAGDAPDNKSDDAELNSPAKHMADQEMGQYGVTASTPAKAITSPDKEFRRVPGGGSPGSVQRKKRKISG
jgi:hypothetical protein